MDSVKCQYCKGQGYSGYLSSEFGAFNCSWCNGTGIEHSWTWPEVLVKIAFERYLDSHPG